MAHEEDNDMELGFLADPLDTENPDSTPLGHEFLTAPLFTFDAFNVAKDIFPQRALLGIILRQCRSGFPEKTKDKRIYVNTNTPSSAVVCGVQGSGKSHTVSCLLEGSLIKDKRIGNLPEPLAAVVFHHDAENSGRPCEAAYLSEPAAKSPSGNVVRDITVLVSPSSFSRMSQIYSPLKNVEVQPLFLTEQDLNISRMFSLMGCDEVDTMPMYMHAARAILREMGSDNFDYEEFKRRLNDDDFNPQQRAMLKLRTDLLDSYIRTGEPSIASYFAQGKLVIVDLTDPFVNGESASALFEIVLGMFVSWNTDVGKTVVFDEAHKYLTNRESARLTKSISSLIRQQRHLAIRVIISTQEPTIIPESILGLTSYIICHKFSSPAWCTHLKHHITVDNAEDAQFDDMLWSDEVMNLPTGEALVFSSGAIGLLDSPEPSQSCLAPLGVGYLRIRTRPRVTLDGGASIMAVGRQAAVRELSSPATTVEQFLSPLPSKSQPEILPASQQSRRAGNIWQPSPPEDTQQEAQPETPPHHQSRSLPQIRTPSPPPPNTVEDPRFSSLLKVLREELAQGNERPSQIKVATILLFRDPAVYKKSGCPHWPAFCDAAKDLGLIELSGPANGNEWMSLTPQTREITIDSASVQTPITPVSPSLSSNSVPTMPPIGTNYPYYPAYPAHIPPGFGFPFGAGPTSGMSYFPTGPVYPSGFPYPLPGMSFFPFAHAFPGVAAQPQTQGPISSKSMLISAPVLPAAAPPAGPATATMPRFDASSTAKLSKNAAIKPFRPLISALARKHKEDIMQPLLSDVHQLVLEMKSGSTVISELGGWKDYCKAAEKAKVVRMGKWPAQGGEWITLRPPYLPVMDASIPPSTLSTSQPAISRPVPPPSNRSVQKAFATLRDTLHTLRLAGFDKPFRSMVADALLKQDQNIFKKAGFDKFREFSFAAEAAGVVEMGGDSSYTWIKLPD